MPDYRRPRLEGGTFFFTVVTHGRRPFLCSAPARECLRSALRETMASHPFVNVAFCLLPDHLHCVWTLPDGDADFSVRWRKIKGLFTARFRAAGGEGGPLSESRAGRREAGVWQRRFWEHWIRDEEDLRRHLDYVHYNPVKHGLVARPGEWRHSTFLRFERGGAYPRGWGEQKEPRTCVGLIAGTSEPEVT